jgi:hypothetical protein
MLSARRDSLERPSTRDPEPKICATAPDDAIRALRRMAPLLSRAKSERKYDTRRENVHRETTIPFHLVTLSQRFAFTRQGLQAAPSSASAAVQARVATPLVQSSSARRPDSVILTRPIDWPALRFSRSVVASPARMRRTNVWRGMPLAEMAASVRPNGTPASNRSARRCSWPRGRFRGGAGI